MKDKPTQLLLSIADVSETCEKDVEELTRRLRHELLELEVDAVDRVGAEAAPTGAKGDAVTLGTLLVTLAASGGVLTSVINTVQSWLTRQEHHSVTVEIGGDKLMITSVSSDQQQQLIDDFVSRHKSQ